MRAIEINAKTDNQGQLILNYPLHKKEQNVRIIILVEDNTDIDVEEKLWLNAVSLDPAFDFLKEPEDYIYSINGGESFSYKK
ncbi:MAG: hypothetical protein PHT07_03355 [Paludibacter sp.]|nr:hypothetical protein [Paludibacter sp.]